MFGWRKPKPKQGPPTKVEVLAEAIYYASAERNGLLFIDTYDKADGRTKQTCINLAKATLQNEVAWRTGD